MGGGNKWNTVYRKVKVIAKRILNELRVYHFFCPSCFRFLCPSTHRLLSINGTNTKNSTLVTTKGAAKIEKSCD